MDSKNCVVFALFVGVPVVSGFFLQSVGAAGNLLCANSPAKNVTVLLYVNGYFSDTLLDDVLTGDDGRFELYGSKREFGTIEPYVEIRHKCKQPDECIKRVKIKILPIFVVKGSSRYVDFPIKDLDLADWRIPSRRVCQG